MVKVIYDISTLARHTGQSVGIVRVVRELALWARVNRPDTSFVIFDYKLGAFRNVTPAYLDLLLEDRVLIDSSRAPDPVTGRRKLPSWLPSKLDGFALWLRNPRYRSFVTLDRLFGPSDNWLSRIAEAWLLKQKHKDALRGSSGKRRTILTLEDVLGSTNEPHHDSILLCSGSDWNGRVVDCASKLKESNGIKVAQICYDTIPLVYPHFYPVDISDGFLSSFRRMATLADVTFVTANKVAIDLNEYCMSNGIPQLNVAVFALGADELHEDIADSTALPNQLEPGKYAMLVATIEPRKGHRLLFEVWKKLLEEKVPQESNFKLLFLGRKGWLVDSLIDEIRSHSSYQKSLLILSGVDDAELSRLYRNVAFTLLPSLYEGYGLPIVESFRYGKPVLSSERGALPEVVNNLSPCLDPLDEIAWIDAIRAWIKDPRQRVAYENRIEKEFVHPTWSQAASGFYATLDSSLEGST